MGTKAGLIWRVSVAMLPGNVFTTSIVSVSSINAKIVSAIIAAGLLAGTEVYLYRQHQIQTAQPTNNLSSTAATHGQLHAFAPGTYITSDQLAYAGFDTPANALQSVSWAMMKGSFDQANGGLTPEEKANETADANNRAEFEKSQKEMASGVRGFQILAMKTLSDKRVELKERIDAAPIPGRPPPPVILLQPMVKVDNQWRLSGSHSYSPDWDSSGQIETYAQ